jgi:hypothetical protein
MTTSTYYSSDEYALKERIVNRLHGRVGRCGHCGKRHCAAKSGNSVLPLELDLDDVLQAIALDTPEPPKGD